MTSRELYQQKLSTADAAMSLIHSGDTIVSGTYACEPLTLLRTLHTIAPRVRDVKAWCAITKIQPVLPLGSAVSISRSWVDCIVTEYGVACLKGASIRQRVERLIAIAHPDFRAELRREAEKLMLW